MEFCKIQCPTGKSELKHTQINPLKGDSKYTMEACKLIRYGPKSRAEQQITSRRKDVLKEIVSKFHVTNVGARKSTSKLCFRTYRINLHAFIMRKTSPFSSVVKIFSHVEVTCRTPGLARFLDRDPRPEIPA